MGRKHIQELQESEVLRSSDKLGASYHSVLLVRVTDWLVHENISTHSFPFTEQLFPH